MGPHPRSTPPNKRPRIPFDGISHANTAEAQKIRIGARAQRVRRLPYLAPAVVFVALIVVLGWGLNHDPHEIPSAMIEKSVSAFNLPPVKGRSLGLSDTDLKGEVSLV